MVVNLMKSENYQVVLIYYLVLMVQLYLQEVKTQSLATTTLGALGEHQILDGLEIEDTKDLCFIIIFSFSVGETGRYSSRAVQK